MLLQSHLPVVEDNAESTCLSPTTELLLGGLIHQLFLLRSFLSLTFSQHPQRECHSAPSSVGVQLFFLQSPAPGTFLLPSHGLIFPPALSLIAMDCRIALLQSWVSTSGQGFKHQRVPVILGFTCPSREVPLKPLSFPGLGGH